MHKGNARIANSKDLHPATGAITYTFDDSQWLVSRQWMSSLVLLPLCIYFLLGRDIPVFLEVLNLYIHEAGHLCFFFFGDFFHAAGGSIMQILLPATLVFHFFQYYSIWGIQLSSLWLGQNALNISIYAADARSQELSLLYNRKHDWMHMLQQTDMLPYDTLIAALFCCLAIFSFITLLLLPGYLRPRPVE